MTVVLALFPNPTLAFDPDLIIYGIGTVIVVGSWIVNSLRKTQENRKRAEEGKKYRELGASPVDEQRTHLDDIAERRRAQLREMARQRGGQSTAQRGGGTDPSNMTMAERIARARAKEQYRQRADTMQDAPRPQSEVPEHAAEDLQRQREQERAERERQAAAEERRAAQRAEEKRQQEAAARQRAEALAARRRQARQQATRRAQAAARSRTRRPNTSTGDEPKKRVTQAERAIEKHMPKSAELTEVTSDQRFEPIGIAGGQLTANQLRQAFVMKEVLDKPVALRKTTELEMPW